MLNTIDQWLLDKPYQGAVELSQKAGAWWVEQCGWMLFCMGILRQFLKPKSLDWVDGMVLILDFVCAAGFFWYAKNPALLAHVAANASLRMFMFIMCVPFGVIHSLSRPTSGQVIVELAYNLAFVSAYYFAACKPPRLREPRRKLVPSL